MPVPPTTTYSSVGYLTCASWPHGWLPPETRFHFRIDNLKPHTLWTRGSSPPAARLCYNSSNERRLILVLFVRPTSSQHASTTLLCCFTVLVVLICRISINHSQMVLILPPYSYNCLPGHGADPGCPVNHRLTFCGTSSRRHPELLACSETANAHHSNGPVKPLRVVQTKSVRILCRWPKLHVCYIARNPQVDFSLFFTSQNSLFRSYPFFSVLCAAFIRLF
ncbi:uncharacterized protein EI97DRAFT_568 [Westerdykella ornata]|uniref:Uncharacterized protein n=1 Tax=Westerdykella ornata TaxID=318751 RepID=A0A6A6JVE3_WESOR|nr:uncharacterized protein EI97DRAFT_568 [Westerdykella ornata]KAF2280570.1 hypothetical protein EI97DRAFT_568 [Westerdykella ornata]